MSSPDVHACPLCHQEGHYFTSFRDKRYYACPTCMGRFMHSEDVPTLVAEKTRYIEHNNDVTDLRYQAFVTPIVDHVKRDFNPTHRGLDFGSGTGPVIAQMLKDTGFNVALYDPFFSPYPEHLNQTYDFIVCCEVMEHFHHPDKEFHTLKGCLKQGSALYMKTELWCDSILFSTWFYKTDPTHVFFYHPKTLEWIQKAYGFKTLEIFPKHFVFTV